MIICNFDKVDVQGIEPLILTELTLLMRTIKDHIEAKHGKEYADDKIRACIKRAFVTEEEIEELKRVAERFKDTLDDQDVTKIAEADVAFHDVIYTATDNQKLILLLNNLREQMYRYRVEYLKKEEAYPQLIAEHEELIDNISKRNKEEATRIMCEHIDNQVATVINVIHTKKV